MSKNPEDRRVTFSFTERGQRGSKPSEKRSRVLETLTGTGFVYQGDSQLARVRFSLTVTRERDLSGTQRRATDRPPVSDIRGVITILQGERHLPQGSNLVLRLSDGRQWEFIAQSGNFISGEYVAVGTGKGDAIAG